MFSVLVWKRGGKKTQIPLIKQKTRVVCKSVLQIITAKVGFIQIQFFNYTCIQFSICEAEGFTFIQSYGTCRIAYMTTITAYMKAVSFA